MINKNKKSNSNKRLQPGSNKGIYGINAKNTSIPKVRTSSDLAKKVKSIIVK